MLVTLSKTATDKWGTRRTTAKTVAARNVVPRLTVMPAAGAKVGIFWTPADDVLRTATISAINPGGATAKVAVPGTTGGPKVGVQWMTPLEFAGPAAGRRCGPATYGETEAAAKVRVILRLLFFLTSCLSHSTFSLFPCPLFFSAKARVEAIAIGDPVIAYTPTAPVSTCVELSLLPRVSLICFVETKHALPRVSMWLRTASCACAHALTRTLAFALAHPQVQSSAVVLWRLDGCV